MRSEIADVVSLCGIECLRVRFLDCPCLTGSGRAKMLQYGSILCIRAEEFASKCYI